MTIIDYLQQGHNFARLMNGLWVCLRIALISCGFSIVLGFPLGFVLGSKNRVVKWCGRIYLEFFRILPQLVLLFIFYFGIATALGNAIGVRITPELSAVIVFSLWGTAEFGDLVRGAVAAIPRGQIEAGEAVGLNKVQVALKVTIPQTIKALIPTAVNLFSRIIKTTSIVPLIGVVEILKVGQQIIDFNRRTDPTGAIWIYGFIFCCYFVVCFALSELAKKLSAKI
jgi:polar amino acid transport system permease protein